MTAVIPDAFQSLQAWLHQDSDPGDQSFVKSWVASLSRQQARELQLFIEERNKEATAYPSFKHVMRKHAPDWRFRERDVKSLFQNVLRELKTHG